MEHQLPATSSIWLKEDVVRVRLALASGSTVGDIADKYAITEEECRRRCENLKLVVRRPGRPAADREAFERPFERASPFDKRKRVDTHTVWTPEQLLAVRRALKAYADRVADDVPGIDQRDVTFNLNRSRIEHDGSAAKPVKSVNKWRRRPY